MLSTPLGSPCKIFSAVKAQAFTISACSFVIALLPWWSEGESGRVGKAKWDWVYSKAEAKQTE